MPKQSPPQFGDVVMCTLLATPVEMIVIGEMSYGGIMLLADENTLGIPAGSMGIRPTGKNYVERAIKLRRRYADRYTALSLKQVHGLIDPVSTAS